MGIAGMVLLDHDPGSRSRATETHLSLAKCLWMRKVARTGLRQVAIAFFDERQLRSKIRPCVALLFLAWSHLRAVAANRVP